jgi:hypothetical protein
MALRLCDVRRDPIANRALEELLHRYTAAEEENRLVLTAREGNMKLFFYKLDDLHQLDFIDNQLMAKENEKLRGFLRTIYQQRESWKHRALAGEAELLDAIAKTSNAGARVSDLRYATLKRYLVFCIPREGGGSCWFVWPWTTSVLRRLTFKPLAAFSKSVKSTRPWGSANRF